jgi:hypothetical protein
MNAWCRLPGLVWPPPIAITALGRQAVPMGVVLLCFVYTRAFGQWRGVAWPNSIQSDNWNGYFPRVFSRALFFKIGYVWSNCHKEIRIIRQIGSPYSISHLGVFFIFIFTKDSVKAYIQCNEFQFNSSRVWPLLSHVPHIKSDCRSHLALPISLC